MPLYGDHLGSLRGITNKPNKGGSQTIAVTRVGDHGKACGDVHETYCKASAGSTLIGDAGTSSLSDDANQICRYAIGGNDKLFRRLVVAILPVAGFAAMPAQAQTAVPPGAQPVCLAIEAENAGDTASVDLPGSKLKARADGSVGVERTSFAEARFRITTPIAYPATLKFGINLNGLLRGAGGGNLNFSRVRATAEMRETVSGTVLHPATTVFDKTEKGKPFQIINNVVTSNPFDPPVAAFSQMLEVDKDYTITIRLTTNAQGGFGARSDFNSGNRGLTYGCLTVEPDWKDTDGDGIYDQWETVEIDIDGDGVIDLDTTNLGTDFSGQKIALDPKRKDVLVEIDWFDCAVAGSDCGAGAAHSHRPRDTAMAIVKQAFAASPVNNPDGGADGINLWLQPDEALAHQQNCDLNDGCFDAVKAGGFGTASEKGNAKLLAAKALIYRYNLWVHDKNMGNTSSGEADGSAGVPGDDFVVSLGSWGGQIGTLSDQAGTLMHELGHTLGLGHGGVDDTNCKPNHLSVMSYTFQVLGLQPGPVFDFSRNVLPQAGSLKENALDETVGIQDGGFQVIYGPLDMSGALGVGPGNGPVDWDRDGSFTNTSAQADINFLGITGCGGIGGTPNPNPTGTLAGSQDWGSLIYSFRGSPFFPAGEHGKELDEELDRESAERLKDAVWQGRNPVYWEYPVKMVCGIQNEEKDTRFAPGRYATVVNIRNPGRERADFRKRLSLAYPPPEQAPGQVLPIAHDSLEHEEALKVDCPDLQRTVFQGEFPTPYIDGFVVIQSPVQLDVRAVYTMATPDGKAGSSIDVEPQLGRFVDLRLPNLRSGPALSTPEEANLPEGFPGVLYCVKNPQGGAPAQISAIVRNAGPVLAAASSARANFGGVSSATAAVGPLAAGAQQTVTFDIPRGCYGPGFSASCKFTITADGLNQVSESVETDNQVHGFCVSPAG